MTETLIDYLYTLGFDENDEAEEIIRIFNDESYYHQYYDKLKISDRYQKAIRMMFDRSLDDLYERAYQALNIDPFCAEAAYVLNLFDEDDQAQYEHANSLLNYDDETLKSFMTNSYERTATCLVINSVVNYFTVIRNLKKAIALEERLMRVDENEKRFGMTQLILLYSYFEDEEKIRKIYLEEGFANPLSYLLYIQVMIKNRNSRDLGEVVHEFIRDYPDALTYLDNPEYKENDDLFYSFESLRNSFEETPNIFTVISKLALESRRYEN